MLEFQQAFRRIRVDSRKFGANVWTVLYAACLACALISCAADSSMGGPADVKQAAARTCRGGHSWRHRHGDLDVRVSLEAFIDETNATGSVTIGYESATGTITPSSRQLTFPIRLQEKPGMTGYFDVYVDNQWAFNYEADWAYTLKVGNTLSYINDVWAYSALGLPTGALSVVWFRGTVFGYPCT